MGLVGHAEPRFSTPDLPPFSAENTSGFEVLRWMSENLGVEPLPWQRYAILASHALKPDGTLRFRRVVLLCGRRAGKSFLISGLAAAWLAQGKNVLYSSATLPVAREQWELTSDFVKSCPELFSRVRARGTNGQHEITAHVHGVKRRYAVSSQNGTAPRGRGATRAVIDEALLLRDETVLNALLPVVLAEKQSQVWIVSNAGSAESVPLLRMRDRGRAGLDAETTLYLEWSAPQELDIDDPEAWRWVPALGHTIDEEGVLMLRQALSPAGFRTEVIGQWVESMNGAIQPTAWDAGYDPAPIVRRDRVTLGFEISSDLEHASLVACEPLSGGRYRLEVVAQFQGAREVREQLPEWVRRVRPVRLGWCPHGAAQPLSLDLKALPSSVELTGAGVSEASSGLVEAVTSGLVSHAGDPLLSAHILTVRKRPVGQGYRLTNGNGTDAALAASYALYLAKRVPARSKLEMRFAA